MVRPEGNGERAWLAIDLGAGSGRMILGRWREGTLRSEEVHRFSHEQRRSGGRLRWSFDSLWVEIRAGLRKLAAVQGFDVSRLASIGVDAWGVDFGLLDAQGHLVADPVSYRDERTQGMLERLEERIPRAEIYARTGIQFLPFNTLVQLFAQIEQGEWPCAAEQLLLIPDLVHARLGGRRVCERTNASTTQMLSLRTGGWDLELARAIGLPTHVLPELVNAPAQLGTLTGELARAAGLPPIAIVAPATHDTASAVAGTPLTPGWAFISSGTWSLVGVELERPFANEHARALNLTNETGAFGTTRLLKNVMGLWIVERCREAWRERGWVMGWDELLAGLDPDAPGEVFIDPDDLRYLAPRDMDQEVRAALREQGRSSDQSPSGLTRVVLVSLARRYAEVVRELEGAIGREIPGLHIVGGGCQNDFLNQATANASARPVLAGPVEATALGNIMLQAIGDGVFPDLGSAREVVRACTTLRWFLPRGAAG